MANMKQLSKLPVTALVLSYAIWRLSSQLLKTGGREALREIEGEFVLIAGVAVTIAVICLVRAWLIRVNGRRVGR